MIPEGHTIEDIKKREEIITSTPLKVTYLLLLYYNWIPF